MKPLQAIAMGFVFVVLEARWPALGGFDAYFDPLGWRGAKVDMNLQFQRTSLVDPLTGRRRPFNETMTRQIEVNLRHDIPGSDWAWGASVFQYRQSEGFRLDQRFHFLDTP